MVRGSDSTGIRGTPCLFLATAIPVSRPSPSKRASGEYDLELGTRLRRGFRRRPIGYGGRAGGQARNEECGTNGPALGSAVPLGHWSLGVGYSIFVVSVSP